MSKALKKSETVNAFTVNKVKGVESFTLSPKFRSELIAVGSEIGAFIATAEQKIQTAINLTLAVNEYRRVTKNGLPAFVHDLLDPTCPKGYGKIGSTDRTTITTHRLFNGIEYLYKKGNAAVERIAERKALSDAGIDPDDADKVSERNKETREERASAFQKSFVKVCVDFSRHGVTETTISNLLLLMGKHPKGDKTDLSKLGEELSTAAQKAVLAAMTSAGKSATTMAKAVKK